MSEADLVARVQALETLLVEQKEAAEQDINTGWLLVTGALIVFMQCGFAMLSAGAVRTKNTKNIILKNLLDACFGALGFFCLGYGFAYGDAEKDGTNDGNGFVGTKWFFLVDFPDEQYVNWFFQFAFAATAATIVSGAVAERCKFEAYLMYSFFLTAWVYPVVVHWVWSDSGWLCSWREPAVGDMLFDVGMWDFAGSGVVHLTGGAAGLVGAYVLGPRQGRYRADGTVVDLPGHNIALAALGTFILWFGWYGFNPGSTLGLTGGASLLAAKVAVNTTLGGATGGVTALLVKLFESKDGYWDLNVGLNGVLTGLVSITGACAVIDPYAAIVIGGVGGVLYVFGSRFICAKLQIDDPLDASTVHGIGGWWSLIATGFFATSDAIGTKKLAGIFYGGDGSLLGANFVGGLTITVWVCGHMLPFFMAVYKAGFFRVSAEDEMEGLDTSHHGGAAYPEQPSMDVITKVASVAPAAPAPAGQL